MRTTLSLDPDVTALLKRAMAKSKKSLKEQVNEALRVGLSTKTAPKMRHQVTQTFDGGECLIGRIESVSEALAIAEGENHH